MCRASGIPSPCSLPVRKENHDRTADVCHVLADRWVCSESAPAHTHASRDGAGHHTTPAHSALDPRCSHIFARNHRSPLVLACELESPILRPVVHMLSAQEIESAIFWRLSFRAASSASRGRQLSLKRSLPTPHMLKRSATGQRSAWHHVVKDQAASNCAVSTSRACQDAQRKDVFRDVPAELLVCTEPDVQPEGLCVLPMVFETRRQLRCERLSRY